MAIRDRETLKKWFRRGAYPTESQFSDWIDSFLHCNDTISINLIQGLAQTLNSKYDSNAGNALSSKISRLSAETERRMGIVERQLTALGETVYDLDGRSRVVYLSGMLTPETLAEGSFDPQAAGSGFSTAYIYDPKAKTIRLRVRHRTTRVDSYYASWQGMDRVFLPDGSLSEESVYICEGRVYVWTGEELRDVCHGGGSGTGLTDWQKSYLDSLEAESMRQRFSLAVTVTPSSRELDGGYPSMLELKAVPKFDGAVVDAELSCSSVSEWLSRTNGCYADVSLIVKPDKKGLKTFTYTVTAKYVHEGTEIVKSASATFTLFAQCRIVQTAGTGVPDGTMIAASTQKRRQITGTYDLALEPGKYVWLCVPDGVGSISKITSSGFAVPFESPVSVDVQLGTETVMFRCWRLSGAPQVESMNVTIN